jgi:hypothetical protein
LLSTACARSDCRRNELLKLLKSISALASFRSNVERPLVNLP